MADDIDTTDDVSDEDEKVSSAASDKPKGREGQDDSLGFPKGTPVAEMTVEEQAAYWKHQARRHEGRNNGWQKTVGERTPEQLKADLEELDSIRKDKLTPSEKAIEEAKQAGREEARQEFGPRLVGMAFDTALAHIATDERAELIEALNLNRFLDDKGNVDTEAVAKTAARIAPAGKTGRGPVDYGAGSRRTAKASAADEGRREAQRRYGKSGAAA
jgi:hypothetical protein